MSQPLNVTNVKLFCVVSQVAFSPGQLIIHFVHQGYNSAVLPILKDGVVDFRLGLKEVKLFLKRFQIWVVFSFWDDGFGKANKAFVFDSHCKRNTNSSFVVGELENVIVVFEFLVDSFGAVMGNDGAFFFERSHLFELMEKQLKINTINFVLEWFRSFRERLVIPFSGFKCQLVNDFDNEKLNVGFESLNNIILVRGFGEFITPVLFEFLKLVLIISDGLNDRAKKRGPSIFLPQLFPDLKLLSFPFQKLLFWLLIRRWNVLNRYTLLRLFMSKKFVVWHVVGIAWRVDKRLLTRWVQVGLLPWFLLPIRRRIQQWLENVHFRKSFWFGLLLSISLIPVPQKLFVSLFFICLIFPHQNLTFDPFLWLLLFSLNSVGFVAVQAFILGSNEGVAFDGNFLFVSNLVFAFLYAFIGIFDDYFNSVIFHWLIFLFFGSFNFFAPFKSLDFRCTCEFPSSFFLFSIFKKLDNQDFLQISDLNFIERHFHFAFGNVFGIKKGQQSFLGQLADVTEGFMAFHDEKSFIIEERRFTFFL